MEHNWGSQIKYPYHGQLIYNNRVKCRKWTFVGKPGSHTLPKIRNIQHTIHKVNELMILRLDIIHKILGKGLQQNFPKNWAQKCL